VGVTRWEGGRLVLIPYLPGVWDGPSWRSGLDVNENYNKSKTVKYYRVGGSGTILGLTLAGALYITVP